MQGNEDEVITIDASLFISAFDDPEGEPLQQVQIITPPINGVLSFNGSPVTPGQLIDVVDLQMAL